LIVSTAACVEFSSQWPDELGQPSFDGHVNVLILGSKGKAFFSKFGSNPLESMDHGTAFLLGKDLRPFQRFAMGDTSPNILLEQFPIEGEGGGKAFHQHVGFFTESSSPRLI